MQEDRFLFAEAYRNMEEKLLALDTMTNIIVSARNESPAIKRAHRSPHDAQRHMERLC
jgi:hypothetical protein